MKKQAPKSLSLARGLRMALQGGDKERRAELQRLSRAERAPRGRNDLLLNLELVHRDPGSLRLPKRNVRTVKPSHVKEVANSISALGFSVPIVIDRDGTIIDGVVRVKAAIMLGLPPIPCVVADVHTAEEKRLLRLASNRSRREGCLGRRGA